MTDKGEIKELDQIDLLERRRCGCQERLSLHSEYFKEEDIIRPINLEVKTKRELRKDEISCCVYPTKHAKEEMFVLLSFCGL